MIRTQDLTLRAGGFTLEGVAIEVPRGAYGVLMGPTGCGKTTLLEAICGLRNCDRGRIHLEGRDVTHLAPSERGIGYVPQEAAVFRRMTVRQNLAFALRMRGDAATQCDARAQALAAQLGVESLLDRRATHLSGGEAQRVALGRALAAQPGVLLLDEPLSAVDEPVRDRLAELLRQTHRRTGATVLHVTHSHWEADHLADVVYRFDAGSVVRQSPAGPSRPAVSSTPLSR